MTAGDAASGLPTRFQIWGARGSRNSIGSRIGNSTSCYSLAVGADLYVFDAGSGLLPLSAALTTDDRLGHIKRVHLLVSHSHWDHWEGLKDADWMWRKGNGIELTIFGPAEALKAIHQVCGPPSFVPLDILALGTLASLGIEEVSAGTTFQLPGASVEALGLHHYSGISPNRCYLDTLGYRLTVDAGPTVAYVCDHEPTAETSAMEQQAVSNADLAIVDASYGDVSEHAFGHGSIESVAQLARSFPNVQVLAAHHGALRTDEDIEAAAARHASDLDGFSLAVEGDRHDWDADAKRFVLAGSRLQALAEAGS